MSSYIHQSQLPKFADDTKYFHHIGTVSDHNVLQEDITALFTWSRNSDLNFNLSKFVLLSFKCKLDTTYTMSNTCIPCTNSHKDLGLILSEDLIKLVDKHYKIITVCAYKVLRIICRTLLPCHSTSTMVKLYVSLVQSQLLDCTQIWRPHLMKDILIIGQVQRCATKYILNDHISCHKTWLIKLRLLPLMCLFELQDISICY